MGGEEEKKVFLRSRFCLEVGKSRCHFACLLTINVVNYLEFRKA